VGDLFRSPPPGKPYRHYLTKMEVGPEFWMFPMFPWRTCQGVRAVTAEFARQRTRSQPQYLHAANKLYPAANRRLNSSRSMRANRW
jgi:hypothetical protein